jgi:hypothetical protein
MCSFTSLLRGWLKMFHYLSVCNGLAWVFVGIWVLSATEGSGFGWAIFICALYATAVGAFGVYTVGYRSDRRVRIWGALFMPFLLLQLAILFAFIVTPQPLWLAMENSSGSWNQEVRIYLHDHDKTVIVFGCIGVFLELISFVLSCSFHHWVAESELDDIPDPVLEQRAALAAKGLLPEQQPRHQKSSKAREKLNEKYGGGFSKEENYKVNYSRPGTAGYQALSNDKAARTKR